MILDKNSRNRVRLAFAASGKTRREADESVGLSKENIILSDTIKLFAEHLAQHGECPDKYNSGLRYSQAWKDKCHKCHRDEIKWNGKKCWIEYYRSQAERNDD